MNKRNPKTEAQKIRERDRMRQKRLDPVFRSREASNQHTRAVKDPALYRKRVRESHAKVWTDPVKREKEWAYRRARYKRIRTALIAGYGGKCACCGEPEMMFLELDHVHGGGHQHYKARAAMLIYVDIIKAGFPDDYQLLCSNCNRGRERNDGICPHKGIRS